MIALDILFIKNTTNREAVVAVDVVVLPIHVATAEAQVVGELNITAVKGT